MTSDAILFSLLPAAVTLTAYVFKIGILPFYNAVYVFLGEHIALVDFVRVLQRRGLLAAGEYAVLAVDDEIYDPSSAAITHAGNYTG